MTAGEYYRRERARRPGEIIYVPMAAELAEMVNAPNDPDGEAWLRRALATLTTTDEETA